MADSLYRQMYGKFKSQLDAFWHSYIPPSLKTVIRPISPRNINAYSTPEIMRIKDMVTPGKFSDIFITSPQYFYKKSMGTR